MSDILPSFSIFPHGTGLKYGVEIYVPELSEREVANRRYKQIGFRIMAVVVAGAAWFLSTQSGSAAFLS